MAIYHMSVQIIKRSKGRSAVAAASYRSGEKLKDERQNLIFDYTRKSNVDHTMILAPDDSPSWAKTRAILWNQVEKAEIRKDAQLAREINVAIPRELSKYSMITLVQDYVQDNFVADGMIADVCFHDLESSNPHAHIMLTTRVIDQHGFGNKNRDWNNTNMLEKWRENWAVDANNALDKNSIDARIDHRTLVVQGIDDRPPQIHLGYKAKGLCKRGERSFRDETNQARESEYQNYKDQKEKDIKKEWKLRAIHTNSINSDYSKTEKEKDNLLSNLYDRTKEKSQAIKGEMTYSKFKEHFYPAVRTTNKKSSLFSILRFFTEQEISQMENDRQEEIKQADKEYKKCLDNMVTVNDQCNKNIINIWKNYKKDSSENLNTDKVTNVSNSMLVEVDKMLIDVDVKKQKKDEIEIITNDEIKKIEKAQKVANEQRRQELEKAAIKRAKEEQDRQAKKAELKEQQQANSLFWDDLEQKTLNYEMTRDRTLNDVEYNYIDIDSIKELLYKTRNEILDLIKGISQYQSFKEKIEVYTAKEEQYFKEKEDLLKEKEIEAKAKVEEAEQEEPQVEQIQGDYYRGKYINLTNFIEERKGNVEILGIKQEHIFKQTDDGLRLTIKVINLKLKDAYKIDINYGIEAFEQWITKRVKSNNTIELSSEETISNQTETFRIQDIIFDVAEAEVEIKILNYECNKDATFDDNNFEKRDIDSIKRLPYKTRDKVLKTAEELEELKEKDCLSASQQMKNKLAIFMDTEEKDLEEKEALLKEKEIFTGKEQEPFLEPETENVDKIVEQGADTTKKAVERDSNAVKQATKRNKKHGKSKGIGD